MFLSLKIISILTTIWKLPKNNKKIVLKADHQNDSKWIREQSDYFMQWIENIGIDVPEQYGDNAGYSTIEVMLQSRLMNNLLNIDKT